MHQGYWWNSWNDTSFCNPEEGPVCLAFGEHGSTQEDFCPWGILSATFCQALNWGLGKAKAHWRPQILLSTFIPKLCLGNLWRASSTPLPLYPLTPSEQHLLGLVETGFSSSRLQELGRLAGWNPKNRTMGHIAQNPPVSCTLRLGGGRRGERAQLLPLHSCGGCGLRFLLLPHLCLHLGERVKWYVLVREQQPWWKNGYVLEESWIGDSLEGKKPNK